MAGEAPNWINSKAATELMDVSLTEETMVKKRSAQIGYHQPGHDKDHANRFRHIAGFLQD